MDCRPGASVASTQPIWTSSDDRARLTLQDTSQTRTIMWARVISDSRGLSALGSLSGGGVSERPKERASKAREGQLSAGSNPAATASLTRPSARLAASWAPAFLIVVSNVVSTHLAPTRPIALRSRSTASQLRLFLLLREVGPSCCFQGGATQTAGAAQVLAAVVLHWVRNRNTARRSYRFPH